jgi:membrane protein DedA with SNARE-associated domain
MGEWLTDLITQGGYAGILLLMLLETVFPPVPSEVIMSAAGFYAARGDLSIGGVIVAGAAGAMVGNIVWYAVARWVGLERMRGWIERHGRWLTMDVEDLDRAQSWFDRYGAAAVGIGRIIPTVRSIVSIPAGFLRMSFGRFLLFTSIGTTAWTATLALAGFLLGTA